MFNKFKPAGEKPSKLLNGIYPLVLKQLNIT
jgi:hypothetical protein